MECVGERLATVFERGGEEVRQAGKVVAEGAARQSGPLAHGDGIDTRPSAFHEEGERGLDECLAGRRRSLCLCPPGHVGMIYKKIHACMLFSIERA